jgi:hypothetical protein
MHTPIRLAATAAGLLRGDNGGAAVHMVVGAAALAEVVQTCCPSLRML